MKQRLLSNIIFGLMMLCMVACMPQNEMGTPFQQGQEVTLCASISSNNLGGAQTSKLA